VSARFIFANYFSNRRAEAKEPAMRFSPNFKIICIALLLAWFYPAMAGAKFGNNGKVITDIDISASDGAQSLILQPDGNLVAAGYTKDGFALVRYLSNGSLDTGFGMGGKVITSISSGAVAYSLIQQPDGKLVAAGYSFNGNNADFALVRYTSGGSLDSSFGAAGKQSRRLAVTNTIMAIV
jgi:uncharacterized delta-60 repeat protein